jgi:hypothetical protein
MKMPGHEWSKQVTVEQYNSFDGARNACRDRWVGSSGDEKVTADAFGQGVAEVLDMVG